MYFQQFKWFLIILLLATCILRYALLLDVLIDIYFIFTLYLINLADTKRLMFLMFCIFKSSIASDMTYHFSVIKNAVSIGVNMIFRYYYRVLKNFFLV